MMAAMKFRKELAYDADPAAVFAMLSDPGFREKVAHAQDVVSVDVRLTPSSGGFSLVNDQVQNTAGLPAIAKKIAGDTTQAVITEEWSSPSGGSISITAPGKPTKAEGTITLKPAGTGTTEVVELDVKVKVPADRRQARAADGRQHRLRLRRRAPGRTGLAGGRAMSRQLVHDLTYDAPADRVTAMLADPAFREEVCDFIGAQRRTVVIEPVGEGMHVTSTSGCRPPACRRSRRSSSATRPTSCSARSGRLPVLGDITVTIPGKPGDMTGSARIAEAHGVTTETVSMTIKVGIPLVGGKLEDLISGLLLKSLKAENKVGRDYLSRS